jgi:hypothetical protein
MSNYIGGELGDLRGLCGGMNTQHQTLITARAHGSKVPATPASPRQGLVRQNANAHRGDDRVCDPSSDRNPTRANGRSSVTVADLMISRDADQVDRAMTW